MSGNKWETGLTGRITASILVAHCLLLPRDLSAQELKDTANPVTSKQEWLFQRLEKLERANTAQQDLIQAFTKEQERLKHRVKELETAKTTQEDATRETAIRSSTKEQERWPQRTDEMETSKAAREDSTRKDAIQSFTKDQERLKQRVEELEITKTAHEDATRSIIKDSLSKLGSNINQYVALGGTLETYASWAEDFSGKSRDSLDLTTAQLDFEIKANDWTTGIFTIEYDNGTDILFPTSSTGRPGDTAIDRVNIETALVTVGDPQKFPPFLTAGRIVLPFGVGSGNPVADVLTTEDPLTLQVFSMRNTAVGFGLGFPTPALTPATPPVPLPPVKPQLINPLISSLSRNLGYNPPPVRPPAPTLFTPTPTPPLFNAGIYTYDGNSNGWDPGNHINATAGFRTKGHCGRRYDQLGESILCPWTIDVDIDYNSSVFDSRFLGFEYQAFLGQIGFVPGMAASAKATLGRVSLVAEWNGAINQATFVDGNGVIGDQTTFPTPEPEPAIATIDPKTGTVTATPPATATIDQVTGIVTAPATPTATDTATPTPTFIDPDKLVSIRPSAWQVSLGYQFDWNPWVEVIGEKGTYLAIGYSESQDLAGVTDFDGKSRVGFVPRRRFLVNVSEWVLDGVRLSVEYSHNVDYSLSQGGTGNSANGVFSGITYVW